MMKKEVEEIIGQMKYGKISSRKILGDLADESLYYAHKKLFAACIHENILIGEEYDEEYEAVPLEIPAELAHFVRSAMFRLGDEVKVHAYRSHLGLPCIAVYRGRDYAPVINRQVSPLTWDRLFQDLFEKACIHGWKKKYSGDYSAREFFRIHMEFTKEPGVLHIEGDGAFPLMFDEMVDILTPFITGSFQGKNIRGHSKGCEYI